jgi:outer membrane murein-binding lipoprotein Lpp
MRNNSVIRAALLVGVMIAGLCSNALGEKVVTYSLVVGKAATTAAMGKSAGAVNIGTAVIFTDTITPAKAKGPTGTVIFTAAGTTSANVVSSSALPISSAGLVQWNVTLPNIDTYTVTAVYSGDSNFTGSQSSVSEIVAGVQDFSITLPPTISVTKGQAASGAISLTPLNGFNGTVTLACSGAPYLGSCAIDNTTVVLSSILAQTAQTSAQPSAVTANLTLSTAGVTVTTAAALLFGLFGFGELKRRRAFLMMIGGLVLATVGLSGCASSNRYTQNNGTPVGSYTITVVATSGKISHTSTTVLNVVSQ